MINKEKQTWGILLSVTPIPGLANVHIRLEAHVNKPLNKTGKPRVEYGVVFTPSHAKLKPTDFIILIESAQGIMDEAKKAADEMTRKAKRAGG